MARLPALSPPVGDAKPTWYRGVEYQNLQVAMYALKLDHVRVSSGTEVFDYQKAKAALLASQSFHKRQKPHDPTNPKQRKKPAAQYGIKRTYTFDGKTFDVAAEAVEHYRAMMREAGLPGSNHIGYRSILWLIKKETEDEQQT